MGFYCHGCKNLFEDVKRLEAELKAERNAHARTLSLLMSGELLRERLRLETISAAAEKVEATESFKRSKKVRKHA